MPVVVRCGAGAQLWSGGRCGYTGEDGFEIFVPADAAVTVWRLLVRLVVSPNRTGRRPQLLIALLHQLVTVRECST